jgi:cobalt-zinc-cadmium efflux system outer membrane protein
VASLVEEGYSAGKFSLLELLDAQRALATARMRFHAAVRDYHGATAAIYRLTAPATGRRETQ